MASNLVSSKQLLQRCQPGVFNSMDPGLFLENMEIKK